ncbi:MAG: ribosome biogenesis GTP-binding protein YihA/YsxC [Bacillota bacterium]
MQIKSAEFLTSVADISQLPEKKQEIAIAGKSNVGKSSFINFLCNNKKLAKTSKAPGRTRLLNYFDCNKGEFTLVDLPGYGYARVSFDEKRKWSKLLEEYFEKSKNLKHIFVIVDIRHNPTNDDIDLINYFYYYNIAFSVIATKSDKLSRAASNKRKAELAASLKIGVDDIILVSSLKKTGKEDVLKKISQIIQT